MNQATRLTVLSGLLTGVLLTVIAAGDGTGIDPAVAGAAGCSPGMSILSSPRAGSTEVQAKALNDRADVVGFADGRDGTYHAIMWKGGKVERAVDLGVLPGYVSSEAYGVNNDRVVVGLLYDKKERTFPFRWEDGRMTVLRGPNGRRQQADIPDRNVINDRGEIAGTLLVSGRRRAVRWTRKGQASFLRALPGHAWTNAWSISDDGVVSGWSRKRASDDGENNPVIWTKSGKVVPLETVPGRADGAAEATNGSGLTVGYLGDFSDTEPESDQAAVWRTRTAEPQLMGRTDPYAVAELVDVNDRGQAAGMSGTFTKTGFPLARPAIWRAGWAGLRPLPVPAVSRAHRVVIAQLNDINGPGAIVGNVYGLAGKDFSKLRRIYPVLWTCPFGR